MAVKVLFLGPLSDLFDTAEMSLPAPLSWGQLLEAVPRTVAEQLQGERIHVACQGHVLPDKTALVALDGQEIALLPPVSGG
ncbi:MAG: MoaD/ThiS family protein [Tsuneonella suprasediminis]|uniref:MoaD/ThiS family protein n=1 Tax=Tsuneonella suprasediminis TaxID=2306996 RepID=A0A419QYT9_9SPHN|nr:MoaD/ThiS family protein [Tsuneonella suprasediminis]RJX65905.1 MoaD/ThiS family protein [Tsuneonella suprasediminis]UBS32542.1 MoaD/ThiS family protein [Altererythrobacter sp. N1]